MRFTWFSESLRKFQSLEAQELSQIHGHSNLKAKFYIQLQKTDSAMLYDSCILLRTFWEIEAFLKHFSNPCQAVVLKFL